MENMDANIQELDSRQRPRRTSSTSASQQTPRRRGRRRCPTSRRPSALRAERQPGLSCGALRTPTGSRRRAAVTRSSSWRIQAQTRLPELGPIRYGRMLVSPFTFFRGAASLMAADLAGWPAHGIARAALRRCAPLELRHLRRAGPAARVQHQRLRRDAAWPIRVGRQAAARREHRGRRPRPRLRRRGTTPRP